MTSAIVLALTLSLAPQTPKGFEDTDKAVVTTTLSAVRENPRAFHGVKVTFPVQFASLGEVHNPFFTRFVPSEYANFYAWADEQTIWDKAEYGNVCGQFFLAKDNEQLSELYTLNLYQRVQVTGIVRNTFRNMPWFEVQSFSSIGGSVSTATLAHLYRGEQHMKKRQWQRAISELRRVNDSGAPQVVAYSRNRNLGLCYLRIGEAATARDYLAQAVAKAPDATKVSTQALLTTAEKAPGLELDRTVTETAVRDAARPMWEAFELEQN